MRRPLAAGGLIAGRVLQGVHGARLVGWIPHEWEVDIKQSEDDGRRAVDSARSASELIGATHPIIRPLISPDRLEARTLVEGRESHEVEAERCSLRLTTDPDIEELRESS